MVFRNKGGKICKECLAHTRNSVNSNSLFSYPASDFPENPQLYALKTH